MDRLHDNWSKYLDTTHAPPGTGALDPAALSRAEARLAGGATPRREVEQVKAALLSALGRGSLAHAQRYLGLLASLRVLDPAGVLVHEALASDKSGEILPMLFALAPEGGRELWLTRAAGARYDVDRSNGSLLHRAARMATATHGSAANAAARKAVKLICSVASPTAVCRDEDRFGCSAIFYAGASGDVEVTKLLLDCDPHATEAAAAERAELAAMRATSAAASKAAESTESSTAAATAAPAAVSSSAAAAVTAVASVSSSSSSSFAEAVPAVMPAPLPASQVSFESKRLEKQRQEKLSLACIATLQREEGSSGSRTRLVKATHESRASKLRIEEQRRDIRMLVAQCAPSGTVRKGSVAHTAQRQLWVHLWPLLVSEKGWTVEHEPKPDGSAQPYFLPAGMVRRVPGPGGAHSRKIDKRWKNRTDYWDSRKLVILHLARKEPTLLAHAGALMRAEMTRANAAYAQLDFVMCVACKSGADEDSMLMCGDGKGKGCDRGWHIGCIKPPLAAIPEDDWFCARCSSGADAGGDQGGGAAAVAAAASLSSSSAAGGAIAAVVPPTAKRRKSGAAAQKSKNGAANDLAVHTLLAQASASASALASFSSASGASSGGGSSSASSVAVDPAVEPAVEPMRFADLNDAAKAALLYAPYANSSELAAAARRRRRKELERDRAAVQAAACSTEVSSFNTRYAATGSLVRTDNDGFRALHYAAESGALGCVQLMLQRGADPHAAPARSGGTTAAHLAARCGKAEVLDALLAAMRANTPRDFVEYESIDSAACRAVLGSHAARADPPFCFDCAEQQERYPIPALNALGDGAAPTPMPRDFVYVTQSRLAGDGRGCRVCHEEGDDMNAILLCDGCESEWHLSCVGLEEVPAGIWLCRDCKAAVAAGRRSKSAVTLPNATKSRRQRVEFGKAPPCCDCAAGTCDVNPHCSCRNANKPPTQGDLLRKRKRISGVRLFSPYDATGKLVTTQRVIYECGDECACRLPPPPPPPPPPSSSSAVSARKGKKKTTTKKKTGGGGRSSSSSSSSAALGKVAAKSSSCSLRASQGGLRYRVRVVKNKTTGWGVFALEEIPAGVHVLDYVGSIVASDFQNDVGEHSTYVLQIGSLEGSNFNFGIDGTNVGNIARLLNHSCDANLEAKVVVQTDKNSPRCAFFSKRAIIVGDELTWTYARHSTGRVACGCGAANCRKWL